MFKREPYIFSGKENLPNQQWAPYFCMSEIGKEYEVLYNETELIMSNTEYENHTHQHVFKEIKKAGKNAQILSIGYGIGMISDFVKTIGSNLTIIEKYQEVIDLDPRPDKNVKVVIGDVNKMDLLNIFQPQQFDVIFSDITEILSTNASNAFKKLRKPSGAIIQWEHLYHQLNSRRLS